MKQVAEEGREAEASAPPGVARRAHAPAHSPHSPHSQNQRWMRAAGITYCIMQCF